MKLERIHEQYEIRNYIFQNQSRCLLVRLYWVCIYGFVFVRPR